MRACLAALLIAAASASAGEEPESRSLEITEFRRIDELSDSTWGKAFGVVGRVGIGVEGVFRLRAQRMVVWLDPKFGETFLALVRGMRGKERRIPIWAVRAVYAEGGRLPAVFHASGRVFRCSRLFYDFTKHEGLMLDATLRLQRSHPELGEMPDLVMRAERLAAVGPGRWTAEEVQLFASDYQDPQVSVRVDRIEIRDEEMGEILGRLMRLSAESRERGVGVSEAELEQILGELEASAEDRRGARIDLEGVTAHLFSMPFFSWGSLRTSEESLLNLRAKVDVGNRGRLGRGAYLGLGLWEKPLGFMVGAGYYDERGPLFDLHLGLDAWDGRVVGRSVFSYLRDHGNDQIGPPPTRNRWWTLNQYRWNISETWRLDGEYSDLSDPNWLRIYDEPYFKEGKELETLLYLRGRHRIGYTGLIGKVRTISFATTVEEMPTLFASLPVYSLVELGERAALQLAVDFQVGNLRQRSGAPAGPEFHTWRGDVDPTLFLSFNAGPVRVVPWATFRFTGYEQGTTQSSLGRYAGSAGLRTDLQLARSYERIRHVINVSLEYEDLYHVSESPSQFFQMDAIDAITPWEGLSFRLRNRFQRRTQRGLETYLSFELFAAWFPEGNQPLGRTGDGFADLQFFWWSRWQYGVAARLEWNADTNSLPTGSLEGWWLARRDILLGGAYRHLEGDSDVVTFTADFEVDTRWRVLVFSQYEFRNEDALDQGLLIQRVWKTAVFGVRVSFDPGEDDWALAFKLDLTENFRKRRERKISDLRPEVYRRY